MSLLTKTLVVDATPDVVWDFLTKRDKLAVWYFPATADLVEGEAYALFDAREGPEQGTRISGRVLKADPPRELVTTFCLPHLENGETQVRWVLTPCRSGTHLLLEHSRLDDIDAPLRLIMALDSGWEEHFARFRKALIPVNA